MSSFVSSLPPLVPQSPGRSPRQIPLPPHYHRMAAAIAIRADPIRPHRLVGRLFVSQKPLLPPLNPLLRSQFTEPRLLLPRLAVAVAPPVASGYQGLEAAEGARIAGASRIIGVDLNPRRFHEAKKFGVNAFVNPKDYNKPVQEVISEITNGRVDRSIECVGNIDAMISAFECIRDGWGVIVLVGVPYKDAMFKTHPVNFLNERILMGTFFGNYKPRSDLPTVVEMYINKELELEKFITHEVPFSEINKAFDYMLQGDSLHCIIRMDG